MFSVLLSMKQYNNELTKNNCKKSFSAVAFDHLNMYFDTVYFLNRTLHFFISVGDNVILKTEANVVR